ncbi:unnamed protein product [Discula destructiva]
MDKRAIYAAVPALIWSSFVYVVQSVGLIMLFRHYSAPPRKPVSPDLPEDRIPHVTVIRPVKGLEPELYACLASTFRQNYSPGKLSVSLCVASEDDPAYPILEQIVEDFSATHDVRLLVEEYDPLLSSLDGDILGPNPKIRNISRAYREAKGDLIWIIDCNIWISPGVAGRMVDKLMGLLPNGKTATPFRFVHHLPLAIDIPEEEATSGKPAASAAITTETWWSRTMRTAGGRLDEMFFTTTHAKFYGAINTVGVAPCIIGKSNMFRKSHLDTYTTATDPHRGTGVDFFSSNICEDHLIGDLLWNAPLPPRSFRKHGLVWGDVALQPVATVPVSAYCARRVRWLRARKWTVLLATLVEPGVESLLCNLLFAYAATTLPWFSNVVGIPRTWGAMVAGWALGVAIWGACDRAVYRRLQRLRTVEVDANTPAFVKARRGREAGFGTWLCAWVWRELLAFPIWTWAVLGGSTVTWRGKTFRVHRDMSVVAVDNGVKGPVDGHTHDVGVGYGQNGGDETHPEMQPMPRWEVRPSARQRISRSHLDG